MKRIALTTTGRRSGKPRTVQLYAFPDGNGLVVVGSAGGQERHPGWVANLRADPRASIKRGRSSVDVRASEVTKKAERERLWQLVVKEFPYYERYQRRTDRLIPLFLLEEEPEAETT